MKVTITAPESLKEITLGSWQRFTKITEPDALDVLECFAGVARENSRKLNYKQVEQISTDILTLFKDHENEFKLKFDLDGKKFGFITNLDSMSYGEFEDLINYSSSYDNLHRTMAILYRPIQQENRKTYTIEDYEGTEKYCDEMLDVPLDIALGSNIFFYNLLNDLLSVTLTSTEKALMKKQMNSHLNQDSLLNGEGTTNYTSLLERTLKELKQQQN